MTINREWILRRRPAGLLAKEDLEYRESTLPDAPRLEPGQVLLRNQIFLCAPTMRNWMNAPRNDFSFSIPLDAPVWAYAAGTIVASARPGISPGQRVITLSRWTDYFMVPADQPLDPIDDDLSLTDAVGILGMNAITAYFGLLHVGQPVAGDTLLVSGAAGSTGSMAAQIGKLHGCRVIGIAGGAAKCAWLSDELGLDGAVDYKNGNVYEQLRALCPEGVNIFFDNVGGDILQAGIEVMARKSRIVLCGQIAAYNDDVPARGPTNMMRLIYGGITMQGFLQRDYADQAPAARRQLRTWYEQGRLKARVDVRPGFKKLPETFSSLFSGGNQGTLLAPIEEDAPARGAA